MRAAWLLRPFAWGMGSLALDDPQAYLDMVAQSLNAADGRVLQRKDVRAMFAEDLAIPASAAQALAARVRGAELSLFPGEGHLLIFERWREILAWLLR